MVTPLNVITDFLQAAEPKNNFARDLQTQVATLKAAGNGANLRVAASPDKAILYRVNPYLLHIKPEWNSRDPNAPENIEHVHDLAQQIAEHGVLMPVTVLKEDGVYYITDGHCRYLATMRAINELGAQVATVPIMEENKWSKEEDRLAGQILRNGGKQLSTIEKGRVLIKLTKLGWTTKEMKRAFKYSDSRIVQLLQLHRDSTPEIARMIASGEVAATFAANVLRVAESAKTAEEVLHAAVETAKSRGRTKASGKDLPEALRPAPRRTLSKQMEEIKQQQADDSASITETVSNGTADSIADLFVARAEIEDDAVTLRLPKDLFHRVVAALKGAFPQQQIAA
jgi:ParB-like chromosome segregation protein Spo0J